MWGTSMQRAAVAGSSTCCPGACCRGLSVRRHGGATLQIFPAVAGKKTNPRRAAGARTPVSYEYLQACPQCCRRKRTVTPCFSQPIVLLIRAGKGLCSALQGAVQVTEPPAVCLLRALQHLHTVRRCKISQNTGCLGIALGEYTHPPAQLSAEH